jgi:DNA polymerase III alpha subunit
MSAPAYSELQCTSHFSFLRGASSCDELFTQAALLGIGALAITDRNSLAGIVRAHEATKATGIRLIVGCRLDLQDGTSFLVYPTDRPAYARLCRLLSLGKKRGGKAKCVLEWADLLAYSEGLIAVFIPDEADETCALTLRRLHQAFADRAYMALTLRRRPNDQLRLHELSNLAMRLACRPLLPMMSCFTFQSAVSFRTLSLASGTIAQSTMPVFDGSGTPTVTLNGLKKCIGCSPAIRRRLPAHRLWPIAAGFHLMSWPINIPKNVRCRG